VIIPLVIFSATIVLFQIFELNLPGVQIFDQDVGMMSYEDTIAWVDQRWNQTAEIQLTYSEYPEVVITLKPQELGLWVDPQATANEAFAVGRSSDPLTDITASVNGASKVILPVLYYDENAARQTLNIFAETLEIPPENAAVTHKSGAWVALPGSEGRAVDIEATLADLYDNAFTNLLTQEALLYVKSVPPEISDLSPVIEEIESVVAQDLSIEAYDPIHDENFEWTVPSSTKMDWVTVNPETYQVHLAYDADDISDFLRTLEETLVEGRSLEIPTDIHEIIDHWENNQSAQLTIHHDPTTYQVGAGESLWSISLKLGIPMWYIMDANEGLTINSLEAGMILEIPSKNVLLPLPVIPDKRIIIDISEQRMTVYENGEVRNTAVISTGVSDSPTMAGIFQIRTHEINAYASNWDLWMPHFMGIYEAWPGFMNGIHGLPLLSGGGRLWASTLGTPASYGCIILDLTTAEDLYYWADPGVVVEIRP